MTSPDSAALAALLDRQAITDCLHRYPRGIDRCDEALLKSVFWPDGQVDFGSGWTGAHDWCTGVVAALKAMDRTAHRLTNVLIALDGPRATAETYCDAYHELTTPEGKREMIVGGRYLDRLERRDGEWRIAERRYVMDWNQNAPSSSDWTSGLYATLTRHGKRWPDDPAYHPD